MGTKSLTQLGLGSADLTAIGKLSETGLSQVEIADAVVEGDKLKKGNIPAGQVGAYTKAEVDALVAGGTDLSDYYTKTQVDSLIDAIPETDLTNYYNKTEVDNLIPDISTKQDTLVSATNIKTINGESILGSGDIVITGGGSGGDVDLTVISKLSEKGMTPDEIADGIEKIHNVQSSASEIDRSINNFDKIELLIPYGNMLDIGKWSAGTIEANGLRLIGSSAILKSNSNILFSKDSDLTVVFHAFNNEATRKELKLAFYNGIYAYQNYSFYLEPGENKVVFTMPRGASFVVGSYKLYLNAPLSVDINIKSILITTSDISTTYLLELYNYYGFKEIYTGIKVSQNAVDKVNLSTFNLLQDKVDKFIYKDYINLYAYPDTTIVSDNPTKGIFAGKDGYVNAIQRAINSIPATSNSIYIIHVIGSFIATTFEEMCATDPHGNGYRSMVSVTRDNIIIIGEGEKTAEIFADLPSTGNPVNYSFYQTIQMENKNSTMENIIVKGRNVRYPIHTEGNSPNVNINGAVLNFNNVHFWHLGNTGQAWTDWKALYSYGIGFSRNMTVNVKGCRFTSTISAGFGGHDGYNIENVDVNIESTTFDSTTSNNVGMAIDFGMFGKQGSKFNLNLIGNNFNNGTVYIRNINQAGLGKYCNILGSGNTPFVFSQKNEHGYYPNLSDVKIFPLNTTDITIPKYTCIDSNFNLATGAIYAISFTEALSGSKYEALKNTTLKLTLLRIATGQTIDNGDYVEALNGEIVKSAVPTNAKCIRLASGLHIELKGNK